MLAAADQSDCLLATTEAEMKFAPVAIHVVVLSLMDRCPPQQHLHSQAEPAVVLLMTQRCQ